MTSHTHTHTLAAAVPEDTGPAVLHTYLHVQELFRSSLPRVAAHTSVR